MAATTSAAVSGPAVTGAAVVARLSKRARTTPGRMRLAAGAIVVVMLLVAIVGTGALRARQRATNAVGQQVEPLLVGAEIIYSSLADADATATNTFLKAGLEPPARRQAYLDDLTAAANQLASVARQAGSSEEAAQALAVINKDLPTYSGLVESARVNNRLGLTVGSAYLREGSTLMQKAILPAVGQLYQVEAGRLDRAYQSGQSLRDVIGIVVAALLALGLLVLSQGFVAHRTNRLLNPSLLAATVATVALLSWLVVAFLASASRLNEARTKGSDPVQLLSSARILLSRAQADENLFLVSRGSGSANLADANAVIAELGAPPNGTGGLIERAANVAPAPGIPVSLYAAYLKAHQGVIDAATKGLFAQAVTSATGTDPGDVLPAADQLNRAISKPLDQAQKVFQSKAAAARRDLSLLGFGVIALAAIAAGLAVAGLEHRINEYR